MVSVPAVADAIGGNYTVAATASGIENSADFGLTNKWVPTFTRFLAEYRLWHTAPRRLPANSAPARLIPRDRS